MSGGVNIPIPVWMDALGWIIPGKLFDAIRNRYRRKHKEARNAEYLRQHASYIKSVDHIDWNATRTPL